MGMRRCWSVQTPSSRRVPHYACSIALCILSEVFPPLQDDGLNSDVGVGAWRGRLGLTLTERNAWRKRLILNGGLSALTNLFTPPSSQPDANDLMPALLACNSTDEMLPTLLQHYAKGFGRVGAVTWRRRRASARYYAASFLQ